jgi:predicted phage-related endonuclease
MPDPTLASLSATETPGLFGASPYVTRWMLYKKFADGMDIDADEDARMAWGKKLQPLIIAQAAEDMHLEVRSNDADEYVRRGLLGCTRDAEIICPDRGPGALETKCVFDYRGWMADWNGGKQPPRPHEIQIQQQMFVGDGETPYRWGVIAAWVAGEVKYFEREPIDDLWQKLYDGAETFFRDVKAKREPDPFGAPVEAPWLTAMFPIIKGKTLDFTADANGEFYSQVARAYKNAREQQSAGERMAEPLRAQVLAFAKDADEVLLPGAVSVRLTQAGKGKRINVWWPDAANVGTAVPDDLIMAG